MQAPNASQIKCVKQKSSQEQVHYKDNYGRHYECSNRRTAHRCRPSFDSKPLVAAHRRNDEPKNNRLREAYNEVAENQRMDRSCPELFCAEMQCDTRNYKSANESC